MDVYAILAELVNERKRVDQLIKTLEEYERYQDVARYRGASSRRGRKAMSEAEREEVSRRMKNYWATKKTVGRAASRNSMHERKK